MSLIERYDAILLELQRDRDPGICAFCPKLVAPQVTKPHPTCGSKECKRVYLRLHKRLSRARIALGVAVCNTRPSNVISDQPGL